MNEKRKCLYGYFLFSFMDVFRFEGAPYHTLNVAQSSRGLGHIYTQGPKDSSTYGRSE